MHRSVVDFFGVNQWGGEEKESIKWPRDFAYGFCGSVR